MNYQNIIRDIERYESKAIRAFHLAKTDSRIQRQLNEQIDFCCYLKIQMKLMIEQQQLSDGEKRRP